MFEAIDHIGIAVSDLDQAVAFYRDNLDMAETYRETVSDLGVEAVLLEVGDSHVELLCPLSDDNGVARFLEKRGEGLHHVAYRTADIDEALEKARATGLRLIDEQPRTGIRKSRVAFLHPEATGGVLTEFVEPAH